MTFQPAKLDSLSDSLDVEVKSAEILLSHLESLATGEDDQGNGGADGDERAKRVERVKRAEELVRAYISWLADPSKKFEAEVDTSRGEPSERDVSFPHFFYSVYR